MWHSTPRYGSLRLELFASTTAALAPMSALVAAWQSCARMDRSRWEVAQCLAWGTTQHRGGARAGTGQRMDNIPRSLAARLGIRNSHGSSDPPCSEHKQQPAMHYIHQHHQHCLAVCNAQRGTQPGDSAKQTHTHGRTSSAAVVPHVRVNQCTHCMHTHAHTHPHPNGERC